MAKGERRGNSVRFFVTVQSTFADKVQEVADRLGLDLVEAYKYLTIRGLQVVQKEQKDDQPSLHSGG